MLTVYGMKSSGNCYKVQLLLEQLGRPYRWVEVNSAAGETRTPQYLAMNANGKVPLLEREPGRWLAESNAILCYLAEGSALWPADAWTRAQMLQWLFFEQYSHEPCVAVARFICVYLPPDHARRAELPRLRERAAQALAVMEQHLQSHAFFAGDDYSIADIALFAYTDKAADGGIDLSPYPQVLAWLARVRQQPGHVAQQV
ncbi:glutathione S-transferase [Tahibacter aquaticus]|uniref:Glutathione S-transferase n=1 Tax=Tahibacter aquaticus TaxID=520092 RepID=A0A4R6YW75_9GAMM|nr:glutathione S-transferase family protein [Tahibacter aquaticus]TDR43011.1 glutathione S-transferase [Tahibacter aquaticus]